MTLKITLTPEGETRLRERAAAAGMEPAELARELIERGVRHTSLDEIAAPVHARFVESGMSDDDLGGMLEDAKHAMRAEKRRDDNQ